MLRGDPPKSGLVYDRPEVIAPQPDGLRPAFVHRPQGNPFACPTMGAMVYDRPEVIGLSARANSQKPPDRGEYSYLIASVPDQYERRPTPASRSLA